MSVEKMIKQEIIDEAATEYAEKKWVVGQRAVNKDGFKAGVRWVLKRELQHIKKQTAKINTDW